MRRIVTGGGTRWVALSAVAMLVLAGCSNDKKGTSATDKALTKVSALAGLSDQQDPNIAITEFLPDALSVRAGSSVEWRFIGPQPHTVTFFPVGQTPPAPDSPQGQGLFAPSTPPATSYDGKGVVNSGLLPRGTAIASPFVLTFPTPGEYAYVCIIYPTMTGRVTVADKDAPVDTQADINERADRELNQWLDEGRAAKKKLDDTPPKQAANPDGSTTWTYETGVSTEHTDVLAFAPSTGDVKAGDSVTFVNNSQAPHTATFASGGQVPQDPGDPAVSTPTGPSPFTLKIAGGPYNSGVLAPASPPNAPPPEPARSFTFVIPEAGTYPYVCVYHAASGMGGSIKAA